MKKLSIALIAIIFFMSSFSSTNSKQSELIDDDIFSCYGDCDERASGYGATYGWTTEQEFSFFSECYDAYCGNETGSVEFLNGLVIQ